MSDQAEQHAPSNAVANHRATFPGKVRTAAVYAAQVLCCAVILLTGYRLAHAPSVQWAIVSAVMVMQPGLKESVKASLDRIAANLIGAAVGLLVAWLVGDSAWQFLLALTAVIFICVGARLEGSLRSACVAVTIVMLTAEGNVVASGLERAISVIAGCAVALVVEYGAARWTVARNH
jgi:uncharacterized membrane protein YgaE (UPF0421/DUF939 family)